MASTDSIHFRCMQAMQAVAQALAALGSFPVPGGNGTLTIAAAQCYLQMVPDQKSITLPCLDVTVDGLQEEEGDGNFEEAEVIYPVNALILDRNSDDYQTPLPNYLAWRRRWMKALRDWPAGIAPAVLATLPEVAMVEVRGNLVIDPQLPKYQWVVSGFTARFTTFEARQKV